VHVDVVIVGMDMEGPLRQRDWRARATRSRVPLKLLVLERPGSFPACSRIGCRAARQVRLNWYDDPAPKGRRDGARSASGRDVKRWSATASAADRSSTLAYGPSRSIPVQVSAMAGRTAKSPRCPVSIEPSACSARRIWNRAQPSFAP
jgi:hypothetical protein